MAKNDGIKVVGLVLVVLWATGGLDNFSLGGSSGDDSSGDNTGGVPDFSGLIDGTLTFNAHDVHKTGTTVTSEDAIVIEDGQRSTVSLNGGTLATSAKDILDIYFHGNNVTIADGPNYYPQVVRQYEYPAKEQSDLNGELCVIDSSISVKVLDEDGQIQTATTFAQAMTVSDEKNMAIKVQVAPDKCYGAPGSEELNAVCIKYDNSVFTNLKWEDPVDAPFNITKTEAATGQTIACGGFELLQDRKKIEVPFTIKSGTTEITTAHNFTVWVDDTAFDLHAESNAEIWDYEDEDNNVLGVAPTSTTGYVS